MTVDDGRKIYHQLIKRDYVDDDGKLTDTYFEAKRLTQSTLVNNSSLLKLESFRP